MEITNKNLQLAVRSFWHWFAANSERLKTLHANRDFSALASEVSRELDKVEPQLAWEIGPGKKRANLLTISAEGNPELRPLAEMMIQLAPPNLHGWEFYSSRPARPAPGVVRLSNGDIRFDTSQWQFIPIEQSERGRLDLIIVDDELARSDREPTLKAVTIYLDEALGEDMVENWIGEFSVQGTAAAHEKKIYRIAELPDYLLWATHRERNPLEKPDIETESRIKKG